MNIKRMIAIWMSVAIGLTASSIPLFCAEDAASKLLAKETMTEAQAVTKEAAESEAKQMPSVPAMPEKFKKILSAEDAYILKAGDRIKITIYPDDEYLKGGEMEVSSEGNITLPLMGKVEVEGKTAIEAEREIARIIDQDYLVDPEVVIEVTEKFAAEDEKSVVLLGQIRSPGTYPFPKGERFTLLQAIALAGGFTDVANIKRIKIVRGGKETSELIRANAEEIISGKSPDIVLQNGDVVNVAESIF
ncbi:MAG: polysaccharide export protein [Candidatus Omnitrophica bacterium]|nr:polysaccharide export protein [Candidatus Omnitrophota bacterium]